MALGTNELLTTIYCLLKLILLKLTGKMLKIFVIKRNITITKSGQTQCDVRILPLDTQWQFRQEISLFRNFRRTDKSYTVLVKMNFRHTSCDKGHLLYYQIEVLCNLNKKILVPYYSVKIAF